MIILALPNDIPRLWEPIKVAVCAANEIDEKVRSVYLNDLLHKLLNETAHCFVSVEEGRVEALVITTLSVDTITGAKNLHVHSLYSWKVQQSELWRDGIELIKSFAKKVGCNYITCQSNNPAAWRIYSIVGLEEITRVFSLPLV